MRPNTEYLNSCSIDSTIGSCSTYCFQRKKILTNHPSGAFGDLSHHLTYHSSIRACSTESRPPNCSRSTDSQFTRLNDYQKMHHVNKRPIRDIGSGPISPVIPVNSRNSVNSLNILNCVNCVNNHVNKIRTKMSHQIKSVNNYYVIVLLYFLLVSYVHGDPRTHVELMFETDENLPVNNLIGQIRVPDSYHNHTKPPYLILPTVNSQQKGICNPGFDLAIDQHTGDIRNAVQLDREKCSLYKFLAISLKGISFQITIKVKGKFYF